MYGNMMILTDYEWEEKLKNLLAMTEVGQIHPVTVVADLSHLWRHLDGEVFASSKKNEERQDQIISACEKLNIPPKSVAKVVKKQRLREAVEKASWSTSTGV